MNFFKLYIGDYQRDTAHLSITEHGAYLLMLQHYYATQKPLPVGKALHRMLRAQEKPERDAIDSVSAQFWTTTEAGLVNERANKEIAKADTQAETNRRIAVSREDARKASRNTERDEHEQSTNRATNDQPNHSHSHTVSKTPRESAKGSRLPPGWTPEPVHMAFAESVGLRNGRAANELEKFRDYWAAQPGQKGVKTDWPATWRNWARRAVETLPKSGGSDDPFAGAH